MPAPGVQDFRLIAPLQFSADKDSA